MSIAPGKGLFHDFLRLKVLFCMMHVKGDLV